MQKKNTTILALLFIFNPFLMLFFQNCSSAPKLISKNEVIEKTVRVPAKIHPY